MRGLVTPQKSAHGYKPGLPPPVKWVVKHFSACYWERGIKTGNSSPKSVFYEVSYTVANGSVIPIKKTPESSLEYTPASHPIGAVRYFYTTSYQSLAEVRWAL